ncbi:MAG: tyrosine-protein phosphatase [Rhodospirillales bacterium]|nr:tyrosine-protein phosphatase [Rhodospirillales bacterium]
MPGRRWLPLEGATNFRDLGGYAAADGRKVKWGLVFRSDRLSRLTERDLEELSRLNLRLLFDLRTPEEQRLQPNRLPKSDPPEVVTLTISPQASGKLEEAMRVGRIWDTIESTDISAEDTRRAMCRFYRSYVVDHTAEYGSFLRRLAEAGRRPALVHCAAGKDRTGVAAALLLRVLGVPREEILEDYQLTNRLVDDWARHRHDGELPAHVRVALEAQPDYLLSALKAMDEFGGAFKGYLREALGVSDQLSDALREALLV